MIDRTEIAAFVLAGGASSRMGKDKGLLEILGIPLIVRIASQAAPFVSKVAIVGEPEKYSALGFETFADRNIYSKTLSGGIGPIGGISTTLEETSLDWNLILACDLPFLTGKWVQWLFSRSVSVGTRVVIPQTSRGLEPMAAIYHRDCLGAFKAAISGGDYKVTEVVKGLQCEIVDEEEWRYIDPFGLTLKNMNYPEDYERAVRWHESRNITS